MSRRSSRSRRRGRPPAPEMAERHGHLIPPLPPPPPVPPPTFPGTGAIGGNAVIGEAPMNRIVEVRSFLAALAGRGVRATRLPAELHRLAAGVVHGDREAARDVVGDLVVDLLERRGQSGSIE